MSPYWRQMSPKPEQFSLNKVAVTSQLGAKATNRGGKNKEFKEPAQRRKNPGSCFKEKIFEQAEAYLTIEREVENDYVE